MSSIPDRWKDYKPIGQKIEGTRFIAFKVPLRENISNSVTSDIRLDGNILLKSIPNLGLIIDLTNTYRYYDPNFFIEKGVEHKKLMIPGHVTPPKHLVDKFFNIVKTFLENNPDNDKLIGVHCTHGVNRSGFLICSYMISELNIDSNEALSRFATARGHQIERINYINYLHNLNGTNVSPKTSNWRDKPESSKRADKKETSTKLENWRDRRPAVSAGTSNWRDRDRSLRRDKFERRHSPETNRRDDYNSTSYKNHRRDRDTPYDIKQIPRASNTQNCPNTGNYDKFNHEINNRISDNVTGNYQHLPESTGESASNPRWFAGSQLALRTDYYTNSRPTSDRQRNIHTFRKK